MQRGNAQHLANRTIEVFAERPEVRKIVQFGSLVKGTADQYSDVDLEIIADQSDCIIRDVIALFQHIDEPVVIFPVRGGADQAAYTVLFRHYSFYHRLDIGIGNQDIVTATDFSTRELLVDATEMQLSKRSPHICQRTNHGAGMQRSGQMCLFF
jgi:predicted nucleotidyltransferase